MLLNVVPKEFADSIEDLDCLLVVSLDGRPRQEQVSDFAKSMDCVRRLEADLGRNEVDVPFSVFGVDKDNDFDDAVETQRHDGKQHQKYSYAHFGLDGQRGIVYLANEGRSRSKEIYFAQ